MTHAAIVVGSSPGSVSTCATCVKSTATINLSISDCLPGSYPCAARRDAPAEVFLHGRQFGRGFLIGRGRLFGLGGRGAALSSHRLDTQPGGEFSRERERGAGLKTRGERGH